MSVFATAGASAVPAEEVQRRLAEYRRLGWQRRAPAQVVYAEDCLDCPWAGCSLRIAGVQFRLEMLGDASHQADWMAAWWNGPGLVARCPQCGRHVLFTLEGKRAVSDPTALGHAVLPDDWHERAHLVTRPADILATGKDALPCRT